jgi:cobalt/nickel transport system ATP-binding protein
MTAEEAVIKMRSVSFSYPDGIRALDGVNVEIFRDEAVGIVGPNGAGKSTLLLHLNGLLRGAGTVRVMGMEVNGRNLREIRRAVGLVFQDPEDQLFMPTVYDDVAFGLLYRRFPQYELDARVKEALEAVGLKGFEARSAHHLSFGEKKKVSLATVLALEPSIIALDEPTSNLDPESRDEFIRLLKSCRGTKVVTTHDLDLVVEMCDRAVLLSAGRIVADGGTAEVLGDRALMERHRLKVPLTLQLRNKNKW